MGIRKGVDETVLGECSESQRINSVSQHVMIETIHAFVSAIAIEAIVIFFKYVTIHRLRLPKIPLTIALPSDVATERASDLTAASVAVWRR